MNRHLENDEVEIDLLEVLFAWKRKWWAILIAALLGGMIALGITQYLITPMYTSTTTMLVLTKETTLASLADLQMGSQLTNDYMELITSRPVLSAVIENLNLDIEDEKKLEESIRIENPSNTRILEISVEYADPSLAQSIVNELAEVSSEFIGDMMEVVPPKIIDEGVLPTRKTSPNVVRNILLGLALGLFFSCGILTFYVVIDDTIKSEEDIEKYLGLSTLSSVPDRRDFISSKKNRRKRKKKASTGKKAAEEEEISFEEIVIDDSDVSAKRGKK